MQGNRRNSAILRVFLVFHDQDLFGNRFTAFDLTGGMENGLLGGFETTSLEFERTRGFRKVQPQVAADTVDPYAPVPGIYGPEELRELAQLK